MKSLFALCLVFLNTTAPAIFASGPVGFSERSLPVASVSGLQGFVGGRMEANKTGAIEKLDIDHFVGMLEHHDAEDWWWIGEQPGKWLESAILASKVQRDQKLEVKAHEILARMIKAQQPDGYLGITADRVRTPEKPLRGMDPYEQYFTFHALLTAYEVWGNRDALDAATRLGDYYLKNIGPKKAQFWPSPIRPPQNINTIICPQVAWVPPGTPTVPKTYGHSEIAGHTAHYCMEGTLIVDPILRLYQLGGEKRFLDWSKWVVSMIDTWTGWNTFSKLDQVANGTLGVYQLQPYVHSHTFHMNFLGFLRLYQITGDPSLLRKMEGAWNDIVKHQLYITGGVSVGEHYAPGYERPLEGHVVETCANMSWLQFNQALLEITGNSRYADAIEKLLLNHVFASQTIDGDSNRYHTAPNGSKPEGYFHGPDCCTSSGQRQISMIPQWIYAQAPNTLIVNQFVPSTAEFAIGKTKVTLVQETNYPETETVKCTLKLATPASFTFKTRIPSWCATPRLEINGQGVAALKPGTYHELNRIWKDGDRVELTLPMECKVVEHEHFPGPDAPSAFTRGPVVYALDTVWWDEAVQGASRPQNAALEVGLLSNGKPELVPTGSRSLGPFYSLPVQISGRVSDSNEMRAVFVPFSNAGRWYADNCKKPARNSQSYSYAVWLFKAGAKPLANYAARQARIRTFGKGAFDYAIPGDASEETHHVKAGRSGIGQFKDRTYRHGQSFGYTMKVPTENPSQLVVTYWGGETDERNFDVLINGAKVATQKLLQNKPGEFFEVAYAIPFDLIAGKTDAGGQMVDKVTVEFVATHGGIAGGVFGLCIRNASS